MPKVFKTLASISVWLLFIDGCILGIMPSLHYFVKVGFLGKPDPLMFVSWGLATAQIFLSVVAAKLRQMME
jgi:hypothetical protein